MRRLFRPLAIAITLSLAVAAQAEPILDHLPPDALGFAMVRNIAGTNDKVEKFLKIFEELTDSPLPAPWPFIKAATGLGDGLNEQGDALIALLSGPDGADEPRPMLLAAVSDYSKFAASIGGDASGEICRVTIAGEEVLAARRGSYAMLMNVEHRPLMESILASDPVPAEELAPIADWMAASDLSFVLTPTGVDVLSALGKSTIAAQRAALSDEASNPALAPQLKQLEQMLELYEMALGFAADEVRVAGLALSIDDSTNVRASTRLAFEKDGQAAQWKDAPAGSQSPLAGFPDESFVFAGGGSLASQWAGAVASMMRKMAERMSQESGFENLTEDQWSELEESWKAAMEGVRSTSAVMLPGEKGDPLVSNIFYIIRVDDSAAYLQATRKSYELWNTLLGASTSDLGPKMKYDFEDIEVAGKKGLLMTSNIGEAAADPRVPMFGPILNSVFGKDGKLRVYVVAADNTTVVSGIATEERLKKVMDDALTGATGLAQSNELQTTAKLLEPRAAWQFYISPPGVVAWASRFLSALMATLGGGQEIPAYPPSPPVGFSWTMTGGQFHAEMVWPVGALEQLAAYIKKCLGED